jgi:sugar phosphate isomerase/epimerase
MYTVRDDAERDLAVTLKTVAQIGYGGVELAGYAGKSATEYKALLDENGLRAVSAHVGIDQVRDSPAQVIADAKLFGLSYVVVPWIGSPYVDSFEGFQQVGRLLATAAPVFAAEGITLGYHNHAFEFEKSEGGVNGFDAIFEAAGPDVCVELDTFWVKKAGHDPAGYLKRYAGRTPLVHLKDMDAAGDFAPVGTGTIDYEGSLLPAARAAGVRFYIVEQDSCVAPLTPLESARTSFENLKNWCG